MTEVTRSTFHSMVPFWLKVKERYSVHSQLFFYLGDILPKRL